MKPVIRSLIAALATFAAFYYNSRDFISRLSR